MVGTPKLFLKITDGLLGVLSANRVSRKGDIRLTPNDNIYVTIDTNGIVNDFGKGFFLPGVFYDLKKQMPLSRYNSVRIGHFEYSFSPIGALQIDTLPFEMPKVNSHWEYYHYDQQIYANDKGELFHPVLGNISAPLKYYSPRLGKPININADNETLIVWVKEENPKNKKTGFRQILRYGRHGFYDEITHTAWEANSDGIKTTHFKPQYIRHVFNTDRNEQSIQLCKAAFCLNNGSTILSFFGTFYHSTNHQFKNIGRSLNLQRQSPTAFSREPSENFLWAASDKQSLLKINLKNWTVSEYQNPELIESHSIIRHNNQLFLGTNKGIALFDIEKESHSKFTQKHGFKALGSAQIHHLLKIDEAHFWAATDAGLFLCSYEKGGLARFGEYEKDNHFLPANNFYHISKAKKEGYWLASTNGLIQFSIDPAKPDIQQFKHFNTDKGLPTNELFAAYEDDYGFVWIPTPHGLVQFQVSTGLSKNYTKADGLSNSSFQEYAHARSPDGTFYFGSYEGFNIFHPKDFKEVELVPDVPLIITDFEQHLDETDKIEYSLEEILEKGEIVLQPGDKFFNIRVAMEDYREAEHHQFAYKIAGFQEEWSEDRSNLIRISGLPYGEYVLKIRGRLHNGLLAEPMLEIPVKVPKPFYLQIWFIVLAIAGFLLSVFLFYIWRTRSLKERQKELETSIAEATQTIRQKNEALKNLDKVKSRFFANVSHELRTPLTLILGPLASVLKGKRLDKKDTSMVKLSQINAKGLLQLVNEILDLTKMDSGKIALQEEDVHCPLS